MNNLKERDAMICRRCGHEERASEGYPCTSCGAFICLMCMFKGVVRCERCNELQGAGRTTIQSPGAAPSTDLGWQEH